MKEKGYKAAILKMKFFIYEKKLIGNELIKFIEDDKFINNINQKAEQILQNSMNNSISQIQDYNEVIISLSMIALKNYDGNFWSYVEKNYPNLYKQYSEQKIKGKINDILRKYKSDDTNRYVNYPIMNAIVPIKFISNYYEFMYDIYKVNFQRSLPENIEEELKYVFDGLRDEVKEDQDNLDIAVTNKTYKLIKTTQSIIKKQTNIEELIQLSAKVIKNIDKYYWNDTKDTKETAEQLPYFIEGLNQWKTQFENKEEIQYTGERKERERTSKWKPSFKLKNKKIYLITPIHRVPKDIDPKKINILVYNGEEPISLEEEPIVKPAFGGYIVEPKNIEVDKPIGKLTYILSDGTREIYNSKDSLYRDFIIFNENGNEIKNNVSYSGMAIFASDIIDNEKIDIFETYPNYKLGSIPVNVGDRVAIKNKVIIFDNLSKPGLIGIQKEGAKIILNNKEIPVYSNIISIVFETDKEIENLGIEINNQRYKIKDIEYIKKDNNYIKNITVTLQNLEKEGYNNIKIFNITNNETIYKSEFIIDTILNWTCEEIQKEQYLVLVESSLKTTNEQGEIKNEFYIDTTKQTEAEIYVELENKEKAKYSLQLPIQFYKIDDNNWTETHNYIWYYDIGYNSKLYFKNIEFDEVELYNRNDELVKKFQIDEQNKNIDISTIINYPTEKGLKLILRKEEVEINTIEILQKCEYNEDKSSIIYDPEQEILEIVTDYTGKNNVIVKLINENNKLCYKKELDKNISKIQLKGLQTFKTYTIQFYEEKQEIIKTDTLIYETKIRCYSYNNFVNRYFNINKIFYGFDLDNLKEMKLWKTYILIDQKIDKNTYIGRIYQMRDYKPYYMNNINPVKIELTTTIQENKVNVMITVLEGELEGAGLLIDNVNKTIYDGDNPKLQDIYEYEILLEKREKQ